MINSYDHFVLLAESLQWDETTLDFEPDQAAWPTLGDAERTRVLDPAEYRLLRPGRGTDPVRSVPAESTA